MLNADYQKVVWQKREGRPKWDMTNIDKNKFQSILNGKLEELEISREAEGGGNSPARIAGDLTNALNSAYNPQLSM